MLALTFQSQQIVSWRGRRWCSMQTHDRCDQPGPLIRAVRDWSLTMSLHINYWQYALEIEKAGSIRKAAENLYMGQPNLSRALSELEESIGIRIFERSSQGVKPTKEGADFLVSARSVLQHIRDVEQQFDPGCKNMRTMKIQVPRGGYVCKALSKLLNSLDRSEQLDIECEEAVSDEAIQSVIRAQIQLAMVRFHESQFSYYLNLFKENNIRYEKLWEFDYVVTLSSKDELASKSLLHPSDLVGYQEVVHAHRTANLFLPDVDFTASSGPVLERKIYVNDRSNQLHVIRTVSHTYMWGAPNSLTKFEVGDLVQIPCECDALHYQEGFIRRKGYRLTETEGLFVEKLREVLGLAAE